MPEWKEYTGSDEQIEEMNNSEHGFVMRFSDGTEVPVFHHGNPRIFEGITHYLVCEPHPLADMITRWAQTGQPVYWRNKENGGAGVCHDNFPPFAHADSFNYSFTPFEVES